MKTNGLAVWRFTGCVWGAAGLLLLQHVVVDSVVLPSLPAISGPLQNLSVIWADAMPWSFQVAVLHAAWGVVLGYWTVRAGQAVLGLEEKGAVSGFVMKRAAWIFAIEFALQSLFILFGASYYLRVFGSLWPVFAVSYLSDVSLQWSMLLIFAALTLRRMEKGMVQVGEGMRW